MISTLTYSVVSLAISGTLTDILASIGFLLLIALLFQKELASVAGERFQNLVKALNVAIVPLLMAFVLIFITKIVDVIR